MEHQSTRKRPWLAAALAVLVTGLGHLYLRRWMRALGWLLVMLLAGSFVEPDAVQALWRGESVDAIELAPALVVAVLSTVDAYVLAMVHNRRGTADTTLGGEESTDEPSCPHCGKAVDPELDFCQWCTEPLDGSDR
ncbi:zinc ribbon domain-containing protein [Halovivax cerinus]|uniref:Zinc ribbon domain-containing protein n=1 Tax=Halovivax cerinus TaxID=1487865 RepID=A0ABD5NII3_9EURY|nr:zinc ribbon domain-containing protein [Halovivax cerinus]